MEDYRADREIGAVAFLRLVEIRRIKVFLLPSLRSQPYNMRLLGPFAAAARGVQPVAPDEL